MTVINFQFTFPPFFGNLMGKKRVRSAVSRARQWAARKKRKEDAEAALDERTKVIILFIIIMKS